jgi:hypothetical protein
VWGREGMRKLWSAANIKVYGGGVSEVQFLSELSQLIGDFDLETVSTSTGKGGRSASRSVRRERILDVADLAGLPKGRAVVLPSGAPATLARTLPWMSGPRAAEASASIRAHDPAAGAALAEAMEVLTGMQEQRAATRTANPWLQAGLVTGLGEWYEVDAPHGTDSTPAAEEAAPELYYPSVEVFVRELLAPPTAGTWTAGGTGPGAHSGGGTPRPSCGWRRCGGRGSTCAWTRRWECRCGCVTTPTTTWPSC